MVNESRPLTESEVVFFEGEERDGDSEAAALYIEPNPIVYRSDNRILIVDDEKYNLDAMMFILKGCFKKMGKDEEIVDHLVDYANDGQEAIDMYKRSGVKG